MSKTLLSRSGVLLLLGVLVVLSGCQGVQRVEEPGTPSEPVSAKPEPTPIPCVLPEDYPVRLVSVEVDPVYDVMLEPQQEGWLGSDAAHSIPLSDEKTLWLFGDTLVGTITDGKRSKEFDFINSSVGIQDRTQPPPGNMEYFWGVEDGVSQSFFPHQPGTAGQFYWTSMGLMLRGELFLFAFPIDYGDKTSWIKDTIMIRIPNPQDPPGEWIQHAFNLGIGNSTQNFHTALYVEEPYLYCMGRDNGNSVLSRVLVDDLIAGKLGEAFEFWVEGDDGPCWGPRPESFVTLFHPGVTESDIHYEPEWGLYFCTTYFPSTPEIYLTVAPKLTGPWSEPACIYQVPEHSVSFPIGSYAVRPHPELSTKPGELIITYMTNASGDTDPLFTEEGLKIYYPRFLRVQVELAE